MNSTGRRKARRDDEALVAICGNVGKRNERRRLRNRKGGEKKKKKRKGKNILVAERLAFRLSAPPVQAPRVSKPIGFSPCA